MDENLTARGQVRDRAIFHTFVAGAGAQVGTVLAGLVALPFVTRSLAPEEYGVLVTLTGFLALLAFADLGIGSALTTRLAHVIAHDERRAARPAVSTAVFVAISAGVAVLCLTAVAALLIPWGHVLGAPTLGHRTLRVSVAFAGLSIAVSIPGTLGQRVLYGLHRGAEANRWLLAATVVTAAVSIVVALLDPGLPVFVCAALGTPAAVSVLCTVVVLRREIDLRPSLSHVSAFEWRTMRGASGWFFLIAVSAAFGFQTDALIVAAVLGAPAAGVYGVAVRVFGLILQGLYPAMLQLWPSFTDAYARRELDWVKSRFVWSSLLAMGISGFASVLMVLFGDDLIRIWLTADLVPPTNLMLAMASWTTFSLAQAPLGLLLNGAGRVRAHALMALAVALINLPLSLVLTRQLGIAGPALGSLVASAAVMAFPGLILVRRSLVGAAVLASRGGEDAAQLGG